MENGTMRRSGRVLLIVLTVLVVLAGAGAAVVLRLDTRAKEQHEMLSRAISARETWLSDTRVRLTENGAELGSYTLDDLGLVESARSYITVGLTQLDLLPQEEFEALGLRERISWSLRGRGSAQNVTLDAASLDTAKPEADANRVERTAPQDARVSFEDGKFTLQAETGGNTLRDGAVHDAIAQALTGVVDMGQEPQTIEAELTDIDCYEMPEITEENTAFDMQESFEEALDGFSLTVNFEKAAPQLSFEQPTQTISQEQAQALVTLNADGTVMVDEAGVRALADGWAALYDIPDTKYQFKSEVDGYVPIQFLDVSYKVDCDALTKELRERLRTLDAGEVVPEIVCCRNGEPFDIKDTYIEVDITNQKVTFYKDGERIVFTDVVTGLPDGHQTITGLFYTYYKATDIWLDGPDYHVFVKYWVSMTDLYGLHDASWRSNFGGDYYLYAGSHGCVNTPEEAMKTIYDNVTDGIPILSYHHERPVQEEPEETTDTQETLD